MFRPLIEMYNLKNDQPSAKGFQKEGNAVSLNKEKMTATYIPRHYVHIGDKLINLLVIALKMYVIIW